MTNVVHFLVGDSPRRPYYAVLCLYVVAFAFSFFYLAILPAFKVCPPEPHGTWEIGDSSLLVSGLLYFSIGTQTYPGIR
jgi:hypothetical protein